MHHRPFSNEEDSEALAFGEVGSSLSTARRAGQPVILVFSQRPAARCVLADAMEPDEGFESLGSIAVRLLAEWKLPKMLLAPPQGGGKGDASA
jgi:hypothetical protein